MILVDNDNNVIACGYIHHDDINEQFVICTDEIPHFLNVVYNNFENYIIYNINTPDFGCGWTYDGADFVEVVFDINEFL